MVPGHKNRRYFRSFPYTRYGTTFYRKVDYGGTTVLIYEQHSPLTPGGSSSSPVALFLRSARSSFSPKTFEIGGSRLMRPMRKSHSEFGGKININYLLN